MSGREGQRDQCWELRWGQIAKSTDLAREETRAKLFLGQKTVLNISIRREGEEPEPLPGLYWISLWDPSNRVGQHWW